MTDSHPDLPAVVTPTLSVADSLTELKAIARSVKSLSEWKQVGRKATPEEIALAATTHAEWMCKAHSNRTGLPCENRKMNGGEVCHKHGGSAAHVKKVAEARYRAEVAPTLNRIVELRDQDNHLPTAMKAAEHLIDRALGPVKSAGHDPAAGFQIMIGVGFLGAKNVENPNNSDDSDIIDAESAESAENADV